MKTLPHTKEDLSQVVSTLSFTEFKQYVNQLELDYHKTILDFYYPESENHFLIAHCLDGLLWIYFQGEKLIRKPFPYEEEHNEFLMDFRNNEENKLTEDEDEMFTFVLEHYRLKNIFLNEKKA